MTRRILRMSAKHLYIAIALASTSLCAPMEMRAEPSGTKFMGTGSCSSSNCHGSVNALKGTGVLQNEYHTWLKHDRHSQAYAVLGNADSKRISELMKLGDPQKEPLCLNCHATFVPDPDARGPKYQVEDGVSCESCHGAAEKYLSTHTVAGTTHEKNLEHGLKDIVSHDKRAKLCLSCHYGTDEKTVNHDLYGAGHPRLSFELDTFGVLQPKHWVVDEDYRKRKGDYSPLNAWYLGQVTQAEEILAALESPKRSKNGMFPELSLFDCNSCHHSLTEDQWKSRSYDGRPGQLNLNLPSLVLLREAALALDPKTGEELRKKLHDLHVNYKNDGGKTSIPALKRLVSGKAAPLAARFSDDQSASKRLLKQLSAFAAAGGWSKYEVAEQITMGIQAALATSPALGQEYKQELDALFGTLKSSEAFSPDQFTAAAKRLNGSIR